MDPTSIGLGAKWVERVLDWFAKRSAKRLGELNEVNAILTQDPEELARLYVEPDFQLVNPANSEQDEPDEEDFEFRIPAYRWLDKFLVRPRRRDGRHVAFILSDAGMGKSSLLAMLKMTSSQGFWPGIKFRLFKIDPTIVDRLEACESPVATVLLLDSLDEDRAAYGRIQVRLVEILSATKNFRQTIITCRTQFFPLRNEYERDGARIKIGGHSCKVVYLSPFSERQVDVYLQKVYPRNPQRVAQAKTVVSQMRSLRMRPMLLAHIEDLMESGVTNWTAYRTHRALIDVWLDREEAKAGSTLTAQALRRACERIALRLQIRGERLLKDRELDELLSQGGLSAKIRRFDFGGKSLLNRTSDGDYRFSHYSIQEFLVADKLISSTDRELPGKVRFSEELIGFLASWYAESRETAELPGAKLGAADLAGAFLRNANLEGVHLRGANLNGADLSGANLGGASLEEADLSEAIMEGANLSGSQLHNSVLSGAHLARTTWRGAELTGARFAKADVRGANFSQAAGLTPKQLEGARGDKWTFVPKGGIDPNTRKRLILRPVHWPEEAVHEEHQEWVRSLSEETAPLLEVTHQDRA